MLGIAKLGKNLQLPFTDENPKLEMPRSVVLCSTNRVLHFARHWKTGTIAALAALLVFQAAGWFLALGVLQIQAKNTARFAMHQRETPLETVTLAASFLQKIRVGKKEIRLEGRLYDIKNQTFKGDSVALVLYHDKHEEALLDAAGKLLSPSGGSNAAHSLPLQNWLAKWLGSAFLIPSRPVLPIYSEQISAVSFHYLLLETQAATGRFSPPPESISMLL